MIFLEKNLYNAYNWVKEDAAKVQGCSVIIYAAPDCDSLCSLRILTTLLQTDCIQYKIKPVCGYESLAAAAHLVEENEDFRTIILLNCGGSIDISLYFQGLRETSTVYVFDSHRPYHVSNLENKQVWLVGEETEGDENRLMRESIKDSSPAGEENAEDNQSEEATASSDDSDMSEGEHSGKMAR